MPFAFGGFENSYYDLIYSNPIVGKGPRPIATVSKKYSLIQHHELIKTFEDGMSITNMHALWNEAELTLSEYGERMRLSITLPGYDFDPGDGYPILLRINCLNSVDRSTALEINLSWFRQVCSNGMVYGLGKKSFRKIHLYSHTAKDVAKFIEEQTSQIKQETGYFEELMNHNVKLEQVLDWADGFLSRQWSSHLAARACNIAKTGFDGKVIGKNTKCPSSQKQVSQDIKVPGAFSPANNACHIYQTLSWLTRSGGTIQGQMDKMMDAPRLVNELIEKYTS